MSINERVNLKLFLILVGAGIFWRCGSLTVCSDSSKLHGQNHKGLYRGQSQEGREGCSNHISERGKVCRALDTLSEISEKGVCTKKEEHYSYAGDVNSETFLPPAVSISTLVMSVCMKNCVEPSFFVTLTPAPQVIAYRHFSFSGGYKYSPKSRLNSSSGFSDPS